MSSINTQSTISNEMLIASKRFGAGAFPSRQVANVVAAAISAAIDPILNDQEKRISAIEEYLKSNGATAGMPPFS